MRRLLITAITNFRNLPVYPSLTEQSAFFLPKRQQKWPLNTLCWTEPADCLDDRISETRETPPSSSLGVSGIAINSFLFPETLGTAQKARKCWQTELQPEVPPACATRASHPQRWAQDRHISSWTPTTYQNFADPIAPSNTTILAPHLCFRSRAATGVINRKGWNTTT